MVAMYDIFHDQILRRIGRRSLANGSNTSRNDAIPTACFPLVFPATTAVSVGVQIVLKLVREL